MSAAVDEMRRQEAHDARNARAKERLRVAMAVHAMSFEGLEVSVQAERLGVSAAVVVWWRAVLGWGRVQGRAGRGVLNTHRTPPEEDRP